MIEPFLGQPQVLRQRRSAGSSDRASQVACAARRWTPDRTASHGRAGHAYSQSISPMPYRHRQGRARPAAGGVRVEGEQSHRRHWVDASASGACAPTASSCARCSAVTSGWVMARIPTHPRMHGYDFPPKRGTAEADACFGEEATKAQTIESVCMHGNAEAVAQARKADAVPRFCRNPPMRISAKARIRKSTTPNAHYSL